MGRDKKVKVITCTPKHEQSFFPIDEHSSTDAVQRYRRRRCVEENTDVGPQKALPSSLGRTFVYSLGVLILTIFVILCLLNLWIYYENLRKRAREPLIPLYR